VTPAAAGRHLSPPPGGATHQESRSLEVSISHRRRLLSGGLGELLRSSIAPGLALVISAVLAVVWANSPWAWLYHQLFDTFATIDMGVVLLSKPSRLWINDGLMAMFFLMVGLEVKREVLQGELSSFRKASLPVASALGGMLVPALFFVALNHGGPGARGWAVPMATDIAFALGVLALLGRRVPVSLKVFLAAFAVADDIGAVIVIALFYGSALDLSTLAGAAIIVAVLVALNRSGVVNLAIYLALGVVLWILVLKSGVHATVAGVVLAMTVPLRPPPHLGGPSPLARLEHSLHPWVSWVILPLFALANAGVTVLGGQIHLLHPVALGVGGGLLLGKLVGVPLAAWIAVRLGLGSLPEGARWSHMLGLGLLGGIGFTMSIFVAELAFSDHVLVDTAKVGILVSSTVAGLLGLAVLAWAGRPRESAEATPPAAR